MSALSARQRRILSGLIQGDPVFEVPQKSWFTQFNERSGRQARVLPDELADMEARGWLRRVSAGAGHCDYWEITEAGREVLREER